MYRDFLTFIFSNKSTAGEIKINSTKVEKVTSYITYLGNENASKQYTFDNSNLKKINTFNQALLKDYKDNYDKCPFKAVDIDSLFQIKRYIDSQLTGALKIKKAMGLNDSISQELILKIKTFNENFTYLKSDTLRLIIRKLKNEWIRDYMWIREGSITINPFDFTSNKFVEQPQLDADKSKIYNTFINTAIDSLTLHAKYSKLEELKNLLKERNNGENIYSFKEEHDKLINKNQIALNALITTTITVNSFPKIYKEGKLRVFDDTVFINYTNKKVENEYNSSIRYAKFKKLERPITTDDTKNIYYYNIPSNIKLKKYETQTTITDESNFQSALGQIVAQSAILATTISELTSYGSMFEQIKTIPKVALPPTTTTVQSESTSTLFATFQKLVTPKSKDLEKVMVLYTLKEKTDLKNVNANELFTFYENVKNEPNFYSIEKEINKVTESYQETFRKNLYYIKELNEIFKSATIPPDIEDLKEKEEKSLALYRTELVSTKSSDDAVEKKVILKGFDTKTNDSTLVTSFKYIVGKRYPFAVSAGFIYNIGSKRDPLVQTTVSKDPTTGAVKIENTSQPYRFVAGIHIYPFRKGLFLQDNRLLFTQSGYSLNRFSLYSGCAISKRPLDNLYFGIGYDVVPGLKLTAGFQSLRNDKVTISNNEILTRTVKYTWAGFIGVNIDPLTLTKALINFNKLKNDKK